MLTTTALFWLGVAALGNTAQPADCSPGSPALLRDDTAQACAQGDVAVLYLRGLVAARDAFGFGGSPESLALVRATITTLEARTPRSRQADIVVNVLRAAAAAAQSEREEMALFLAQAIQIEMLQFAAREPGAPLVTAHEVAGDLWLRVFRYADARQAYLKALSEVGPTPRVLLGIARAEARLKNGPNACPDTQTTCP
jgi:hypothetical protein